MEEKVKKASGVIEDREDEIWLELREEDKNI